MKSIEVARLKTNIQNSTAVSILNEVARCQIGE